MVPTVCTHTSLHPCLCLAAPLPGVLHEPSESSIHPSRFNFHQDPAQVLRALQSSPQSPPHPPGEALLHLTPITCCTDSYETLTKLYANVSWLEACLVPVRPQAPPGQGVPRHSHSAPGTQHILSHAWELMCVEQGFRILSHHTHQCLLPDGTNSNNRLGSLTGTHMERTRNTFSPSIL